MSRVVCFGELLVDRIQDGGRWLDQPGGAPANVACALARWGVPAALVTAVGRDPRGAWLVDRLGALGVDLSVVQRVDAPTRAVEVLRDARGDRRFGGFGGPPTTAFADTRVAAARLPPDLLRDAFALVCGTIPLATPGSAQALDRCVALARRARAPVVLDVNWRPGFWPRPESAPAAIRALLARVNWLKLSREEALWLFDRDDPTAIHAAAPHLDGVLCTDGPHGCRWSIGAEGGHAPALDVAVVDTTGAGDAFLAGFLAAWRAGRPWPTAVRLGCVAGSLATRAEGAIEAQPPWSEVLARAGET